ncbi:DoxX family protein [Pseudoalteromonas ulvae]|uniref:Quinol oxidase n=1 Tax=Pseudoalteromonas ulvae TaxID=107327 RepID=A0A244CMJ3_PSEDV|nr:DoxX family protein [Pseudoalteromonas ulvae]OUL56830.1 quinol oxidase [Pseudoalteromonas ulvae]
MFRTAQLYYSTLITHAKQLDGIAPLLLRLILAPVLIIAGYSKLGLSGDWHSLSQALLADPNVVNWFGNTEWGLGLPFPDLLAFMAGWSEFLGGWLLLIGLMTRLVTIPLMITMVVAATTVHWNHGWFSITPLNPSTSAAKVYDWLAIPGAAESLENSIETQKRLSKIKEITEEYGNTDYLYQNGQPVILNNGIEFSAMYFVMLLSLFFTGGGRWTSADYYIKRLLIKA